MPAYDGPWELRIFYSTGATTFPTITHTHTMDVRIGTPPTKGDAFGVIDVVRNNAAVTDLATATDEYVAFLDPLFSNTNTIDRAELWHIPEGTTNGEFYSTYTIGETGSGIGTANIASQSTFTFRTMGGSTMRVQLMETVLGGSAKDPYPTTSPTVNQLFDYVIGPTGFFLGRDNTQPFAPMNWTNGQNERLFRKRFR